MWCLVKYKCEKENKVFIFVLRNNCNEENSIKGIIQLAINGKCRVIPNSHIIPNFEKNMMYHFSISATLDIIEATFCSKPFLGDIYGEINKSTLRPKRNH